MFYKLEVYVPQSHVESVKKALFEAGAGKIGNYDCCCFQTQGTGQFRPLPGNNAFIGETDKIEQVAETKLEMLCQAEDIENIISVLKQAHPYETPAFHYWQVNVK